MTETRAVLLAFAGVALVLVAGTALVLAILSEGFDRAPDAAEARPVNQVFDAKKGTFDPVRGIDRVLPTGVPWPKAQTLLAASKFDCKASGTGESCTRAVTIGPCRFDRRIDIGLAHDRRITSTTATETPNCL